MERRDYLTSLSLVGSLSIAGCTQSEGPEASTTNPKSEELTTEEATTEATTREEQTSTAEPTTEESTTEETTTEEQTTEEPSQTVIQVSIDWDQLEGTIANQESGRLYSGFSSAGFSNENPLTHVGARLEYPEQNAIFAQSSEKESAETEGVIRMDVPTADMANLYVAAVSNTDEEEVALSFASIEGISIEGDAENRYAANEFEWVDAEWFVNEEYRDEYESGTFSVDKERESFEMPFKVTYPFHSERNYVGYEERFVGINGVGGSEQNLDDHYQFFALARHPSPGEVIETTHEFYPYLDSEKFNLPGSRHIIKPEGEFTVSWE